MDPSIARLILAGPTDDLKDMVDDGIIVKTDLPIRGEAVE